MALNWKAAVDIVANYKGAPEVKRAQNDFKSLDNNVKQLRSGFSGVASAVKSVVAALAVREVVQYTKSIIDMADNLRDLSQSTGFGVQALSDLKAAAEDSGVGFEGLTKSLTKFTQAIGEANQKGGADVFTKLGIDLKTFGGDANEVFLQVADKLSKYKDGPAKAALANQIFGKSWAELVPLINGGREAIEGAGIVISDDFANRADQFNDRLSSIKRQFDSLTVTALSSLLPAFQEIGDAFFELNAKKDDSVGFFDAIGEVVRILAVGLNTVWQSLTGVGDAFVTQYNRAKSLLKGEGSGVRDKLQRDLEQRQANRLENIADFADKLQKNSLLFGDGTTEEIKARQSEATAPKPGASRTGAAPEIEEQVKALEKEREAVAKLREEKTALIDSQDLEKRRAYLTTAEYEKQKIALDEYAKASKELVNFKNSEQRAAYQAEVEQIIRLKQEMIDYQEEQKHSFSEGARAAWKEYKEAAEDTASQMKDVFSATFKGLEDSILEFVKTGKLSFADLTQTISDMLVRIAIQKAIVATVGSFSDFGFTFSANGNVMTSDGPMPLKKYARGGVATSPQVSIFGEGSTPEAYVPLPDGRSIPVTMDSRGAGNGGNNTSVVVNVNIMGGGEAETDAKANSSRGRELGQLVSMAVKTEIINQMRPGGMLARG